MTNPARCTLSSNILAAFGCFVALLVLQCAFFAENRKTDVDELGLYNPAYMVARYGKLTYPIYAGYEELPVIVHPPVHVGLIGLLARLGLTWYYAEGVPTALFMLLAIWTILRAEFPPPVKLALLFVAGLLMSQGETLASFFGTRPEGALHAAWFASLLLLESGRLSEWNRGRLFAGAFLLTWASSMHYYATPAMAGLVVYLVWAVAALGWHAARPKVFALIAGAMLFAVPYLVLYLAPNWSAIAQAIREAQGGAHLSPLRQHWDWYRNLSTALYLPALLRQALGLGVPLVLFSTMLLAAVRSTRGIAFASLPLQLGILFFAAHKQGVYLIHEIALFGAALTIGALGLLDWLVRRPQFPGWTRSAVLLLAAVPFGLYLSAGTVPLRSLVISAQVHPADLARAATKQILGPHARVVGRLGAWYSSGADSWHEHAIDLIGSESAAYDPVHYLQNFDAAVDYPHRSGDAAANSEHKTLSNWYAHGLLKLRGFYFSEQEGDLRLVLLSLDRPRAVIGYAAADGVLHRFEESQAGDYEVITASCPSLAGIERSRPFIAVLDLPNSNPRQRPVMVTLLSPRVSAEPAGLISRSCTDVGRIRGTLSPVDRNSLVATLRRQDTPIHFYDQVEDVPGFSGVGVPAAAQPPEGTVPLPGSVNLAELTAVHKTAKIERDPRIVVSTPPVPGGFAADLPIHGAEMMSFPHWVRFRLRVLSGHIGLLATSHDGTIISRTGRLLPSPQPIDVALKTPLPANNVVIYNVDGRPGAKVEILDATAVASPADGVAYRRIAEVHGIPPDLQAPAHTVRIESAVKLAAVQTSPITTPPTLGAFAATFPVHFADQPPASAWIQVRLKVLYGRVGLAACGAKGEVVVRSMAFLLPTPEPMDVALKLPNPSRIASFVVFNEGAVSASQFEILDIGAVVPQTR